MSDKIERAKYFTTRRVSARILHDKELKPFFFGAIGGKCVTMDSKIKHLTRNSAIDDARKFREHARKAVDAA